MLTDVLLSAAFSYCYVERHYADSRFAKLNVVMLGVVMPFLGFIRSLVLVLANVTEKNTKIINCFSSNYVLQKNCLGFLLFLKCQFLV
jgi:hypothetical protein